MGQESVLYPRKNFLVCGIIGNIKSGVQRFGQMGLRLPEQVLLEWSKT